MAINRMFSSGAPDNESENNDESLTTLNAFTSRLEISPDVFSRLCEIIEQVSGIALHAGKESLVVGRIQKRMRELELEDARDYLDWIENDPGNLEITNLIDSISTNFTFFYRETDHFTYLRKRLEEWKKTGQGRFRLWSAACSSGEEPFTLAIEASEVFLGTLVDLKILATDISTKVLDKCRNARYDRRAIKSVPPRERATYFQICKDNHNFVEPVPSIRSLVSFRRLNLSTIPYPMQGPFDIIFCRNVMIYFDLPLREKIVTEMHRLLRPGGALVLSHSESLFDMTTPFIQVQPSVYEKV